MTSRADLGNTWLGPSDEIKFPPREEIERFVSAVRAAMKPESAFDTCELCGEPVPVGAWPLCKSRVNPDGHGRPTFTTRCVKDVHAGAGLISRQAAGTELD